jgi:hypothetical protein
MLRAQRIDGDGMAALHLFSMRPICPRDGKRQIQLRLRIELKRRFLLVICEPAVYLLQFFRRAKLQWFFRVCEDE